MSVLGPEDLLETASMVDELLGIGQRWWSRWARFPWIQMKIIFNWDSRGIIEADPCVSIKGGTQIRLHSSYFCAQQEALNCHV